MPGLESLLKEERVFYPPKDLVEKSNIKQFMDKHGIKDEDELRKRALKNPEWFWSEMAKEVGIEWFSEPEKVLE